MYQSLLHISPHACTTIDDVDLNWDDFAKFYKLLYSTIEMLEHVIAKFPYLLHFLDSRVVYMEEKNIPLVGPNHTHQVAKG